MEPVISNFRWFRILRQRVYNLRNGRLIVVCLLASHLCSGRLNTSVPFDEAAVVSFLLHPPALVFWQGSVFPASDVYPPSRAGRC